MFKTLRLFAVPAVAFAFAGTAYARSVPASAGHAYVRSFENCFASVNGNMRNDCPTDQYFEIPLPVDTAGNKSISVSGKNNQTLQCQPFVGDQWGSLWSGTSPTPFPSYQPFFSVQALSSVYVPAAGYLFIQCRVGPGSTVGRVDFSPQ
jgi:hypothetical protein